MKESMKLASGQMPSLLVLLCAVVATLALFGASFILDSDIGNAFYRLHQIPADAQQILAKCASLNVVPGPSEYFLSRAISDRYEPGTNATLIRNATIWTGQRNGTENVVIHGDLLLENGLVKAVGDIPAHHISLAPNLTIVDANRGWVTPGLVDLYSHAGLLSAPGMAGAFDVNSVKGPILPWLRSIDGLNTHDDAFQLAIAGGVTSMQVSPGSANVIGGQAYMIKPRKTLERSPSSMLVEPLQSSSGNAWHTTWRHMIQTCGEDLRQRYGTRMDTTWALRSAYDQARKIKHEQDDFCQKAAAGQWHAISDPFPQSVQWEMLVDVLRGRVKVSSHCSEAVDIDNIIRIANEFGFEIASLHQASEAWLVPDVLKQSWNSTPAVAIMATHQRQKRESYRGSEFAPRVLADRNITVVMISSHPVINARYLLHEAQQAHHFGLHPDLALASVTSAPATAAGLSHRIGIIREGADADVVLWDSHPLQLGATPMKVWIDGTLQIPMPRVEGGPPVEVIVGKGKEAPVWRELPSVPDWEDERKEAIKWEGLPPLEGRDDPGRIVFQNVKELWTRADDGSIIETASAGSEEAPMTTVVVERGKILCAGPGTECSLLIAEKGHATFDLHGGSIVPGFMTFGSPLGLEEIAEEPSTGDGGAYDAFAADIPLVLGDVGGVVRAADALQFGTRNSLYAHRSGVTVATSSLHKRTFFGGSMGIICGLSVAFRTGSAHVLEKAAIVQEVTALHVVVERKYPYAWRDMPSVSQTIAGIRRLLEGWESTDSQTGFWFAQAARGVIPLVVEVSSADIMGALLLLKDEIEERFGSTMRMVFSGATEAHLLAREIKNAGVGVILNPLRPYPTTWSDRRILAGPPLTNDTALVRLLDEKVTVGMGVKDGWMARNTRFSLAWAALESNGRITKKEVFALATTSLENLVGLKGFNKDTADLVAYDGGSVFDLSSKVVAVLSPVRGVVNFF